MPPKLSKSKDELSSHAAYLSAPRKVSITNVDAGDVIRFMYEGEERTVFVLDPVWNKKLHGLTMNVISRRDLMVEVVSKRDTTTDPYDFYKSFMTSNTIKKIDCYRTYNLEKIQNVRTLDYQIDERGREEL